MNKIKSPGVGHGQRSLHCWKPSVVGTLLAYGSAVGYTAANICLRALTHCDPFWVSCVKAFPTLALVGPWLVCRALRNQSLAPSPRVLGLLVLTGLVGQLGGNVVFQWSLSVVGIALAVPLTLGAMILTATLLSRRLLGEHVSRRTMWAVLLLVVAILVLGVGAPAANRAISGGGIDLSTPVGLLYLSAGVLAACLAGVSYCLLGVAIRHAANCGTPVSTILVTVTSVGLVGLGGLTCLVIGPAAMWNTASEDLAMMLLAGVCNAIAFWALTTALKTVSLVYTNALNASQTAMAALAGIIFFHEAPTLAMAAGIALTIGGLLLMKDDQRHAAVAERPSTLPADDAVSREGHVPAEPEVCAESGSAIGS